MFEIIASVVIAITVGFALGWAWCALAQQRKTQEVIQKLAQEKTRLEALLGDGKEQEARLEATSEKILKALKKELDDEAKEIDKARQERFQEKMTEVLKPLHELVKENDKRVKEVEKLHLEDTASLKTHIELMIQDRSRLADALSNSKGRGDWGEMELLKILEDSGLLPQVHFEVQQVLKEGEELVRPDITLKLPNQRVLYIDAKTIMVNLERLERSSNIEEEASERKKHANALEKEVLSLSAKAYETKTRESIDFVVLYVPRESMLRVALEERPALMEMAFRKRVILASPLVLMSILKTVAYGWQQAQISQNALQIHELGKELHKRAAIFVERFLKVGDRLDAATKQFEDAKKSLSGRKGLMNHLHKLEDQGCKSEKTLAELPTIDEEEDFNRLEPLEPLELSGRP